MSYIIRNVLVFSTAAIVWVFFFAPNPWLSFLNIQGAARLPAYALLGVIPVALAIVGMFASAGHFPTRLGLIACVPLSGFAIYLLTSVIGVYSDEGLMGYWLMLPFSLAAYFVGAAIASAIYWASNRPRKLPSERAPTR